MATAQAQASHSKDEAPLIDLGPEETGPVVKNRIEDKGGGLLVINTDEDELASSSSKLNLNPAGDEAQKCKDLEQVGDTDGDIKTIESSNSIGMEQSVSPVTCENCKKISLNIGELQAKVIQLEGQNKDLKSRIEITTNELEREVQRRCELEQRFTEEAKRSTDQISELIAKSNQDDTKLNELRKKFEIYSNETSSMIESFTTNREAMSSQLVELRRENDYLLGKFISKSRDLQNESINLPQTVEELQFHCLTLNEKLICATLAKEQLEDVIARNQQIRHHHQLQ